MAALTEDRNTPRRSGDTIELGVAGTTKIYAGSIVCVNSSGYAVPASTSTTLKSVGRAKEQVDNSSGSDGDKKVEVEKGVYRYANSAGADEITAAEIGSTCYLVDDQTVAKTDGTGTRSAAGTVFDLDSSGVWVKFE